MQIDKGGEQMKQMLQKAEEETIFFLIFLRKAPFNFSKSRLYVFW